MKYLYYILGCCGIDFSFDAVPAVRWYTRAQTCFCVCTFIFILLWISGFSWDDLHFGGTDGVKKDSVEIVNGPKKEENHKLLQDDKKKKLISKPPKKHNDE
jgi:hypothetical protein